MQITTLAFTRVFHRRRIRNICGCQSAGYNREALLKQDFQPIVSQHIEACNLAGCAFWHGLPKRNYQAGMYHSFSRCATTHRGFVGGRIKTVRETVRATQHFSVLCRWLMAGQQRKNPRE